MLYSSVLCCTALNCAFCEACDHAVLSVGVQAEKVYDQDLYFRKAVEYVGEPMTHIESICSSAVSPWCTTHKGGIRMPPLASWC